MNKMINNLYEGNYTSYIYGLIKDQNYSDAIKVLSAQLEMNPRSRAALSLLGYCYYLSGNYISSAEMYEQLIKYYPEVTEYRIYLSQSLYKAENYEEALKACQNIDRPDLSHQLTMLQFAIKYQMNELTDSHKLLDNALEERQETMVSYGCVLYKEGKYEEAKKKFEEAKKLGDTPDIEYNIGVCSYKLKMPTNACLSFQSIIEHAHKKFPELVSFNRIDGIKTQSVGNTPDLL
jgi:tetratricopeptide repeat protein 30